MVPSAGRASGLAPLLDIHRPMVGWLHLCRYGQRSVYPVDHATMSLSAVLRGPAVGPATEIASGRPLFPGSSPQDELNKIFKYPLYLIVPVKRAGFALS